MSELVLSSKPGKCCSKKSQSDLGEWRSKIRQIQLQKASPDVIEKIRLGAERQISVSQAHSKASKLSRLNYIAQESNSRTLKDFQCLKSASNATSSGYMATLSASSARANKITLASRMVSQESSIPNIKKKCFVKSRAVCTEEINEIDHFENEEDEGAIKSVEAELGIIHANYSRNIDTAQATASIEINKNLSQLQVEPTNENELIAKFSLFENASETVTNIRNETLQFWREHENIFTGQVHSECVQDILKIDHHNAMGIENETKYWFVYYMTKKANNNSNDINNVLSNFKTRLEILSQELDDCPICLDTLQPQSITTLSCCHRVCSDCWDDWAELKGAAVFCPLCMHSDFIQEFIQN